MWESLFVWKVTVPFLASLLSSAVAMGLVSIPLRRLPGEAHWALRAREYWPLRVAGTLMLVWMALFTFIFLSFVDSGYGILSLTLGIASLLAGCVAGSRLGMLGIKLPESLRDGGLRAMPAWMLLFPGGPVMCLVMGLTWGQGLNAEAWLIGAGGLLLLLLLNIGGSVTILKLLRVLKPVAPDVVESARQLAEKEGAVLHSVFQMRLGMVNAFASIWTGDILLTREILRCLDAEELRSVMAHEIGHLKETRLTRWKRLISLPSVIAVGLAPAAISAGQDAAALGLVAASLLLKRLELRQSRKLETHADRTGQEAESSGGVYARALEKIHAANLIPAVMRAGKTHPNLYDRMLSAGTTPDFPQPPPPARIRGILGAVAGVMACYYLWRGLNSLADHLWYRQA